MRRFAGCILALLLAAAMSDAFAQPQGSWIAIDTMGEPTPRHENTFVELNGKFYLIGGRNGAKPVDIYDPETNSWTRGAEAPMEIHHFQAVPFDGKIYVVGAWTGGFPREKGIENVLIYDPSADAWSVGPDVPEHRRRGAAGAVVHGDHIYVVAGNRGGHGPHATAVTWLDRFSPKSGEWEELADAPRGRDHFHAALIDDRIYAAAGRTSDIQGFIDSTIAEVDVYDISSDSWSTLEGAEIPTERAGTGAVAVGDHVVVTGGEGFGQTWPQTEALNTTTGEWELIGTNVTSRHGTQLVYHDGKLWIAGGSADQGGGPDLVHLEIFELE